MQPASSNGFLSLLLIFSFPIFSTAENRKVGKFSSSSAEFPRTQVETIIRELNLFPELNVNIVENEPADPEPNLVEKHFRFPNFSDSGATLQKLGHHAGYFRLPHSRSARMFYFFFESRNNRTTDPVVVWLTGGPGCSGSLALFYENGPFHLADNLSLIWNDFSWDKVSNLIYVDQPMGTGFSYSSSRGDIRGSTEAAGIDFYDFLQAFFRRHPQYAKNEFYITGESYAGHYIPAFSLRIQRANKNEKSTYINIKGLVIGNGMINPEIQYKAHADYALQMKLINQSYYNGLSNSVSLCQKLVKLCGKNGSLTCPLASRFRNSVFAGILRQAGDINYYDIRKRCEGPLCYDFSNVEKFLNQESVKKAVGVRDIKFVSCSSVVHNAMTRDLMKNYGVHIPALLQEGLKLFIYAGEYDLICNWLGNLRWLTAMKWSGQKNFQSAPSIPFVVDGLNAGLTKRHGRLTFLKVHNAGHMVPMDQPKVSLEMLRRWMRGQPL
ncbi:Serine carboxypeptidases (lysosomal cathepsin A) [Handroanthus impetiginosus]|uniref:Carboxypeptidase n=1 Tax=Handroanthus impetiginosus TaxID=429701 RepID=A0A2G9GQ08_9LAMI|nr:Serine carboxypeptidases (lysosomal cathepsin A) [Handroanthus impetiginosus]